MNTSHTAGPWDTSRDAVPTWHRQTTIREEATGLRVAIAFESDANALLIAAAPELLDALYTALNLEQAAVHGAIGTGLDVSYHFAKIRSAIAKAIDK